MANQYQQHVDSEVRQALVKLCDSLCRWERNTGRESILILREQGFCFRAISGKPDVPEDIPDIQLIGMITGQNDILVDSQNVNQHDKD